MSDRPTQRLAAKTSLSYLLRRLNSHRRTSSAEGDYYDNIGVRDGGVEPSVRQYTRPRALSLDDVFDGADEHDHLLRTSSGTTSPRSSPFTTRTTTSTSRRSRSIQFPLASTHGRREPADSPRPTSSPHDSISSSILDDKAIDVVVGCCESMGLDQEVGGLFEMRVSRRMCPETVIGHRSAPPPGAEHPTATVSVGTSRVIWEQGEETGNATMALTYAASTPHAPAVSTTTSKPVVLSAAQAGRGGDPNSKLLTSPTPVLTAGARGDTQRVNAKTQAARVPSGSIETESRTAQGSGIGERTTVKVIITERDGEGDGGAIPQRKDRWIRQPKRLINPIFRGKALATSTEDKQHLASPWARGIDDAATPPRAAQCREDDSAGCPRDIEDRAGPRQLLLTATSSSSPPATSPRRHNSEPRRVLQPTGSVDTEVGTDKGRDAVDGQGLHRRERTVNGDNHETLCVPESTTNGDNYETLWVLDNRQPIMNATGSEKQREGSRRRVSMHNAGALSHREHDIDGREDGGFEPSHAPEDLPVALVTIARGNVVKHPGLAARHESCDVVHPATTYEPVGSNDDNSGDDTPGSPDGISITPGSSCSTCKSSSNSVAEGGTGAFSSEHIEEPDTLTTSALSMTYNKNDKPLFISPVHDDRVQYYEHYGTMDFLARQELEQLATERKREDRQRAEEERRRDLASSGQWMNRTSRKMLARGGRVGKPQGRKANSGSRQSVFERLASPTRVEDTIPAAETGAPGSGYPHKDLVLRSQLGGCARQPFQPTISRRSNLLASRKTDRSDESRLCERLHKEWDGTQGKRERRVERADQALRDKAAASYVRPVSERILARRFRFTMTKALSFVDAERRGWLPISGLECVLRECGTLHSEGHQKQNDDVLLAVWGALSEEIGPGGTHSREDANLNGVVCGVPVDRLSAMLSTVASGRHRHDTRENEPAYPGQNPACKNCLTSPMSPPGRRGWRGGERGWGQAQRRVPVVDGALADVRKDGVTGLCKDLRDIFDANRRSRGAGKNKRWSERRAGGSSTCDTMSRLEAEGLDDTRRCVPSGKMTGATPAQVAAMALRFEDKARGRERKIELLRQAEKAREHSLHTFEPCMVATPEGLSLRRKAATLAGQPDTSFGGERSSETAVPCRHHAESYQQVEGDQRQHRRIASNHRTSEEREVEDKCTFRPHFFQLQAPRSLPRHPTEDAANGGVTSTSTSGWRRTTSFWNAQVERLKAGRAKRLRRLETENSTAPRSDPLPPSIQELFIEAGMQPRDHSRIPKHGAQEGVKKSTRPPASPPKLCLERRMRARHKWEQQNSQEQTRKQAEKDAQQEKRKRTLARASRRATANVGLEVALSAREAEAGRWDPPVLIAEVEFVPQARWVLLPLWIDTCASGAVGELIKQEHMSDAVAMELELILRNEMERARLRLGSEHAGERNTERKVARGYRQAIPTVLLSVDTAGDPRLRGLRTAGST